MGGLGGSDIRMMKPHSLTIKRIRNYCEDRKGNRPTEIKEGFLVWNNSRKLSRT